MNNGAPCFWRMARESWRRKSFFWPGALRHRITARWNRPMPGGNPVAPEGIRHVVTGTRGVAGRQRRSTQSWDQREASAARTSRTSGCPPRWRKHGGLAECRPDAFRLDGWRRCSRESIRGDGLQLDWRRDVPGRETATMECGHPSVRGGGLSGRSRPRPLGAAIRSAVLSSAAPAARRPPGTEGHYHAVPAGHRRSGWRPRARVLRLLGRLVRHSG